MNNLVPVDYQFLNGYNSELSPSTVHCTNSMLSRFFQRYLLQKAMSVFEWTMPDTWSFEYFMYGLYTYGFVVVFDTQKYGVIPQMCGLRGYDVFYRPTHAVVTNPLLPFTEVDLGVEGVLLKLQPDYRGVMDLVTYYSDMLAICAETAGINIFNSKLSYVFGASGKTAAESFKKLFDKVASGEPAVVIDKSLFNADGSKAWEAFEQNVGGNYIADKLLADMRKIEEMFLTAVGIMNANTDKKERLIKDEVNANNQEVQTLSDMWLQELKKGCDMINSMFGIGLKVERREKKDGSVARADRDVQSSSDAV